MWCGNVYSWSKVWIGGMDEKQYIEVRKSEEFVKVWIKSWVLIGEEDGRWKDSVKEYMCERSTTRGGGLEEVKRECLR